MWSKLILNIVLSKIDFIFNMKWVTIILVFIFCKNLYAQNLIVEYLSVKKSAEQNYSTYLIDGVDGIFNINIFHKTYSDYSELLKDNDFLESPIYINSLKKNAENVYYGAVFFKKNKVFYKDIIKPIEWKLLNEFKLILGYKCRLAIGTFRGREYKAWFTDEIPSSEGPWKLSGLPGLILAAETGNNFSFEAVKVMLNSPLGVPPKFKKIYSQKESAIDYRTFIKDENAYYTEIRDKQIANLPKNIVLSNTPPIRSEFIERSFEWEETKMP